MGTDIHWVLERQHPDGTWHAVSSKHYLTYAQTAYPDLDHEDLDYPLALTLGSRDHIVFDMFSAGQFHDQDYDQLALPGIPDGASEHAVLELSKNTDIDCIGWFPLERLISSTERDDLAIYRRADTDEVPEDTPKERLALMKTIRSSIEEILHQSMFSGEIVIGQAFSEGRFFPAMSAHSNHQKLQRRALFDALLPVSPTTVRCLVGYNG